jgi:segregation and condensation protein B
VELVQEECFGPLLIRPPAAAMSVPDDLLRAVEATLFAAQEPLPAEEIARHLGGADVRSRWPNWPRHYAHAASIWSSAAGAGISRPRQTPAAPGKDEVRRLSRAATEALAIIAYHEPVSRAEIEAIRGVQTAGHARRLMEAGWVRVAGRREVPGRPTIYATTPAFLTHFGLASRADLPGIGELRAAGLLDPVDEAYAVLMGSDDESAATRRTRVIKRTKRHKSARPLAKCRNCPIWHAKENLKWVAFLYRT